MNNMDDLAGAYVDGELDMVTAKRFERAMYHDPSLQRRVADEQALRNKLSAHFDPVLDEPVPDALTKMLQPNVDTSLSARRERRFGGGRTMQWAAMAATLAIGIAIGGPLLNGGFGSSGPVDSADGQLIASGLLANTLDTQLASADGAGGDYRIGLTFREQGGALCRSFDGADLSGIACRNGGDWQLRRTYPGEAQSAYRQAGSSEMMGAIDAMIAGEPLDADAERTSRDAGWVTE